MYQWLVFAHILAVFGFLLGHGVAAAVAFKLRGERAIERIRVLLDLSRGASSFADACLMVVLVAGIAAGFMGGWWSEYWIWAALGVFILISVAMLAVGSGPLIRLRQLVGAGGPQHARRASQTPYVAPTEQQIALAVAAINPVPLSAIGGGGLILILWLMIFKPF